MHHTSRQSLVVVFLFTLACNSEFTPKPPSNLPPPRFPAGEASNGAAGRSGAPAGAAGAAGQSAPSANTAGWPAPNTMAGTPAVVPNPTPAVPTPPEPPLPAPAFSYAISNLDAAKADFGTAPDAKLDCGVSEIDTTGSVTFKNWCGVQPAAAFQPQTEGSELAVIVLRSLEIASGNRLVVTGSRPIAFVVKGDVTIAGSLDVSAREATPGPGGDLGCDASRGGDGEGRERLNGGGGGGGGFGTSGGAGGDDNGNRSEAGNAGLARGNAELVPLLGGCGGGIGGGCEAAPGAGGGAVQISVAGVLKVTGEVLANGSSGSDACANDAGGAGGGSGGSILLEAEIIDVSGATIAALGGSGGRAQDDDDDDAPASGALNAMTTGDDGKQGDGSGAGGGGGGFGRVRLRSETTCTECSSLW